ncbi:MAG: DUF4286 family protein [Bacteroidetes bacterium]|nr:MAG: DUF4286 family protein [Bacteroidota bacterium]
MIIYNVTVKVDADVADEWLEWMRQVHIPDVMATGYFEGYKLLHLYGHDDEQGITYAIQYQCKDLDTLARYQETEAPRLQRAHAERFKDKYVAFRTILEEV